MHNENDPGSKPRAVSTLPIVETNLPPTDDYASSYEVYVEQGWTGVLPLPRGQKAPPPTGFTGGGKPDPTPEQMASWARSEKYRSGGLCLRLPDDVIGIDVDAYDNKKGAQTLAEAEKRWGPLPPTVRLTSRTDGVSGIRLYRVPSGTKFPGGIKFPKMGLGDIDIVQHHHRYANTYPTFHPDGPQYKVLDERNGLAEILMPRPDELPELPGPWITGMLADEPPAKGRQQKSDSSGQQKQKDGAPGYDVNDALTAGEPTPKVAHRLAKALRSLETAGSRHDAMLPHTLALLRLGQSGQSGVDWALNKLYRAFVDAVNHDRPKGEAQAEYEFEAFITGASELLSEPGSAASVVDEDEARAEAEFWEQRPILSSIQQYASVRRANPYATLGAVLRRAIALVPSGVKLPPIIGSPASVNLYTASMGRSGQGKDIANGVGAAAVRFLDPGGNTIDDAPSPTIGTGEGLARFFRGHGNDEELANVAANVEVNEVGTLGALADRKGTTLVGELLKAFTGQALGFTNAQRATTTAVPAHSYRLCLSISAQPENADFFLSREKDGLPQRFLWLPVVNPYARPPGGERPEVTPADVVIPAFPIVITGTPYYIGVPDSIKAEIENFRYRVEIGSPDVDPLDGHLMLLRLKVAFGLAVLDERRDISMDDWRIAGQLLDVSARVRDEMKQVVRDRHQRVNNAKAHAEADRRAIIGDRQEQHNKKRVEKAIRNKLTRDGSATKRQLRKSCTLTIRHDFDSVFDKLLETEVIVACGDGDKYELAGL